LRGVRTEKRSLAKKRNGLSVKRKGKTRKGGETLPEHDKDVNQTGGLAGSSATNLHSNKGPEQTQPGKQGY